VSDSKYSNKVAGKFGVLIMSGYYSTNLKAYQLRGSRVGLSPAPTRSRDLPLGT